MSDVTAATPHAARIVLDVTGHGERGYASSFTRSLCEAVFAADRVNRQKLRVAFPEIVDAVNMYERVGLATTMALANAERTPGP